jgi:ATP-dependent exoDNAse (exonuclease V) alpha subunit
MAIYHFSVKTIARAHGRSAVAAAAYRSGEKLHDKRLGQTFNYKQKSGVVHTQLILPKDSPKWALDREKLWNKAELAETRANSTVAREFEVALPTELSEEQRQELVLKLAQELCDKHQFGVDVAIHRPGKSGDSRNHHAHILCTTRTLDSSGFTQKTRSLDDKKSGEVLYWRERWATLVNESLKQANELVRVDHRSHVERGLVEEPTSHQGPARTALARRRVRRPHVPTDMKPPALTQSQERVAKQLQTMKARLQKNNLSVFDSPSPQPTLKRKTNVKKSESNFNFGP